MSTDTRYQSHYPANAPLKRIRQLSSCILNTHFVRNGPLEIDEDVPSLELLADKLFIVYGYTKLDRILVFKAYQKCHDDEERFIRELLWTETPITELGLMFEYIVLGKKYF